MPAASKALGLKRLLNLWQSHGTAGPQSRNAALWFLPEVHVHLRS